MKTINKPLSRRQMLRLLGMSAGAALLAGCGGQATEAPAAAEATKPPEPTQAPEKPTATKAPAAEAPAAEAVTLRWYANADPTRNAWMTDVAIPDFASINSNIKVEPMIVPWDEFDPKLTSMFAANDLPEIFANWGSTGYVEYYLRGMCIALDDYLSVDKEFLQIEDIPKSAIDGVTVRGKIVGLPLYILGTYTYYNKELFNAAGVAYPPSNWDDESWTWDAMLEAAKKLTKNYDDPATGQYGVVMSLGSPEELPWLWGHSIWSTETLTSGVADKILTDDPLAIEAYQAQADLMCKHKVAPNSAISQAISATGDPFQAGRVAMNMGGGWGFWTLKEVAGTFKWGAAALPRAKKGVLQDALYADPMLISALTPFKDQAWQFLRYIDSVEGMRKFTVATWSPPSRQALLPDWVNLWAEDLRAELTESLKGSWKYGVVTPWNRIAGYSQFYDAFYSELDPANLCEKSMAEVVPVASQKVNEILAGLPFKRE